MRAIRRLRAMKVKARHLWERRHWSPQIVNAKHAEHPTRFNHGSRQNIDDRRPNRAELISEINRKEHLTHEDT